MKLTSLLIIGISSLCTTYILWSQKEKIMAIPPLSYSTATKPAKQKIQAAILLDVSGSMDGLIEQAKSQLWNMVNVLGKAENNNGEKPDIEIALYEYGRTSVGYQSNNIMRPSNNVRGGKTKSPKPIPKPAAPTPAAVPASTDSIDKLTLGYVKMLSPFTKDLDSLSSILFSLRTSGGDEFCGQVIKQSIEELQWDNTPGSFKVIFIAGNEDFLQGYVKFNDACELAKQRGIIVNTIYCGDRMQGIKEHWNLQDQCGNGEYTNINQNAKELEFDTPYDSTITLLNNKLNDTYLYYGAEGSSKSNRQYKMDDANAQMGKSAYLNRANAKSKGNAYYNADWDLVDADKDGKFDYTKLDKTQLADSLKNKSVAEIKTLVGAKAKERNDVQKQIAELSIKRDAYIVEQKRRAAGDKNEATLETEVEKHIKNQIKRSNMTIK
jgi:hypothetical protein